MPVWVRIDEYAGLFQLFRSMGFTFPQIRDFLARVVQRELLPLPYLAGVIISSGLAFPNKIPLDTSSLVEPSDYNGSISISCYRLTQRVRHTFIIPRILPNNEVEIFTDWCAHEDRWLD